MGFGKTSIFYCLLSQIYNAILFCYDRCGHCKKLAPEYETLGTSFKKAKSVLIAKVSSSQCSMLSYLETCYNC